MKKIYFKGVIVVALIVVLTLVSATSGCAPAPSSVTEPDMSNSALLIIHMQNDVVKEGGYIDSLVKAEIIPPHLEGIQALVPNINKLAAAMRAAGRPVILCRMSVEADYSDALWPYWKYPNIVEKGFFVEGTWGAQLIDELTPQTGDYVHVDKSYNSFCGGALDKTLRKSKVNTVVIAGVHTNTCVFCTAEGALEYGYYVITVTDATWAVSELAHKAALGALGLSFGDAKTTDEVINMIK